MKILIQIKLNTIPFSKLLCIQHTMKRTPEKPKQDENRLADSKVACCIYLNVKIDDFIQN